MPPKLRLNPRIGLVKRISEIICLTLQEITIALPHDCLYTYAKIRADQSVCRQKPFLYLSQSRRHSRQTQLILIAPEGTCPPVT